jgi:hypothetical protein
MKIKFLKTCKYDQNDKANSRLYEEGKVYDLAPDHARRWIRRQAAVEVVPELPAPKAKVERLVPPRGESV